MKKKIITTLFLALSVTVLTACGNSANNSQADGDSQSNSNNQSIEGNSLVAYFSYSGNTETMAETIAENTNSDTFKIETAEAYPNDVDDTIDVARDEQDEEARPELKNSLDNLDDYDVIFLGYPIWWGTLPMGVFTFLDENDFNGKTVIPFATHEGSVLGSSVEDIRENSNGATVLDGLSIQGSEINDSEAEVIDWLNQLNLSN
ncbi:flavodoxin [Enterococcus sp. AZ103]|uniref:flavodoxin n=1 Tax=Enterococcus sp. AZ103 TaxID=2774628 RepID=UPI003F255EAE